MFKYRLYGRSRGRSKKNIDINSYLKKIEKFKISKLKTNINYILDIGTGYGETSIYLANKYKSKTIISCEKYIDGNINLIKNIEKRGINNINIYPANVNNLIDFIDSNNCFDLVWIFFPDPWPKTRHHKRRLISFEFLENLYKFLKPNGEIFITTDSISYTRFILKNIYRSSKFYKWINQNTPFLDLKDYYDIETKFYKKAIISAKKPSIFILKKI